MVDARRCILDAPLEEGDALDVAADGPDEIGARHGPNGR
jgi:hypothetical protein